MEDSITEGPLGPDIAAMRNILAHIEKYPDAHDQNLWCSAAIGALAADNGDRPPCGTMLCFAGWAAFLYAPAGSRIDDNAVIYAPGQVAKNISDFAEAVLRLSGDQAEALFQYAGYYSDLEAMVGHLEFHPDASSDELREACC